MERTSVFWNVQRLFDPDGLPVARAHGAAGSSWSKKDYERKLHNIAACLSAATGGEVPALLGLGEVESVRVLQDLRRILGWDDLVIIDEKAPDPTLDGLDVALLVDGSLIDRRRIHARSLALDNRFATRDLLDVRLRLKGTRRDFMVAVAHWPSRLISEGRTLRFAYSVYLRRLLTSVLKYPRADLIRSDGRASMPSPDELQHRWQTPCIVMGDFNDEPYDESVREALGSTRFVRLAQKRGALRGKALLEIDNYLGQKWSIYNPCWDLRFSDDDRIAGTYYRSEWRTYDQVMFTHGALAKDAPIRYVPGSASVLRARETLGSAGRPVKMTTRSGLPQSFDRAHQSGVSDHLPLVYRMVFERS